MSTSHSVHSRARADRAGRGAEEEYVGCCPPQEEKQKRANKVPRSSRESPSEGLGRVRAGEDEGMKISHGPDVLEHQANHTPKEKNTNSCKTA